MTQTRPIDGIFSFIYKLFHPLAIQTCRLTFLNSIGHKIGCYLK